MKSFEISIEEEGGKPESKNMFIGVILTILALAGGSSIVPLIDEYEEVPTLLKSIWRWEILVLSCIPFTVYYFWIKKDPMKISVFSEPGMMKNLCMSALLWTISTNFYIGSSNYTIVSHTCLLGNLSGAFIITISLIMAKPVHRLEIIGTVMVVLSAIVFINDKGSSKTNGNTNIMFGDFIALMCSPFFGIYHIVNAKLIKKLPTMVLMQVSFTIQLICSVAFYALFMNSENFWSFDTNNGILGWASGEYFWFSILLVGPFTGILGAGGYIFTLNFFPPHIVGSLFLLEPVLAQVLGIILGQDHFPGIVTYIGALGIIAGLGVSIKGDLLRSNQKQEAQNSISSTSSMLKSSQSFEEDSMYLKA